MTKPIEMIPLWVAVVSNKYGVNSYVAVSEEVLRDEIFEYVKSWWQDELGNLQIPQDRDEAIETYFGKVESETCTIDLTTLAGDFEDLFRPLPGDKVTGGYGSTSSPQALKSASGVLSRKIIPGKGTLI